MLRPAMGLPLLRRTLRLNHPREDQRITPRLIPIHLHPRRSMRLLLNLLRSHRSILSTHWMDGERLIRILSVRMMVDLPGTTLRQRILRSLVLVPACPCLIRIMRGYKKRIQITTPTLGFYTEQQMAGSLGQCSTPPSAKVN